MIPWLGLPRARIEASLRAMLEPPPGMPAVDFERPRGEPGIFGPDSVAWRISANPGTMFIGGVSAVYLELAEPRVRSGVWDHTEFRTDPVGRMRRTGLAAMITTYAARADVEALTARVRRMHERVTGTTPEGMPYRAADPELVTWVHVTAAYGFLNAHLRYVDPTMPRAEQDRYYDESAVAARLYGAEWAPRSVAEVEDYLEAMRPRLVDHGIVHEYHRLVSEVPTIARVALPLQRLLVQAAIDVLPGWGRRLLGFEDAQWLRAAARPGVRALVGLGGRIVPEGAPERACRRVGISPDRLRG